MTHPITFKLLGLLAEYGDICREWKFGDKDTAALAKRQEVVEEMNRLIAERGPSMTTPSLPDDGNGIFSRFNACMFRDECRALAADRAATAPDERAAFEAWWETALSATDMELIRSPSMTREKAHAAMAWLARAALAPSVPPVGVGREAEPSVCARCGGLVFDPIPELVDSVAASSPPAAALGQVEGMLQAYIEAIKATGDYERWHYIPEVEFAAYEVAKLVAALPAAALWPTKDESGLSWSGFRVSGDRQSIDEVSNLLGCRARMEGLSKELERERVLRGWREQTCGALATALWNNRELWTCPADIARQLRELP